MAFEFREWNVRDFLNRIPPDLLSYWIAYLALRKRRLSRQDYQSALMTKAIYEKDTKQNLPLDKYMITFKSDDEVKEDNIAKTRRVLANISSKTKAVDHTVHRTAEEIKEADRKREEFFKQIQEKYPDLKDQK